MPSADQGPRTARPQGANHTGDDMIPCPRGANRTVGEVIPSKGHRHR